VTAVASARNQEILRELGADECLDYAKEDFARPFISEIRGFGVSREGTIQWKLNDLDVAGTSKSLRLDATTPKQSEMIRPNMGGSQVITVSVVGEDRLRIDNVRHRIVDVVSDVKVLLVEGERGPTALDAGRRRGSGIGRGHQAQQDGCGTQLGLMRDVPH
jgi:hypothetical protein